MSVTFKNRKSSERGQTLLLFALVAPMLLMLTAFILDVGWGYYVGKKAQNAADAAALAAVDNVLQQIGPGGTVACGTSVECQPAGACPAAGNLYDGCQYGAANGFSQGGDSGHQSFSIAADTSTYAPNVPNIPVAYWTQVVAQNTLPKWFSGMISSAALSPAARATAVLRNVNANGSLYLLNHSSDCFLSALDIGVVCGEDFLALGFNSITAAGGIYMASANGTGLGLPNIAAGTIAVGDVTVASPFTYLMGQGGIQEVLAGTTWNSAPQNGFSDANLFADPMAGRGQPPVPTGLPNHPVTGGVIVGSLSGAPTVLPPGNYYATLPLLGTATGTPITITGNVTFSDGATSPCGGFCNYVVYGGMVTGALSTVTFSPGRYVFAGAQPVAGGPGVGLTVGVNSVVKDLTPLVGGAATANTDAGEIFIFTDTNYPGLSLPAALSDTGLSLPQARAGVSAGLNPIVTLHGLNAGNTSLPSALAPFAPVLIWQDQANTTLKYSSSGLLDTTCGGICSNILSAPGSQEMILQASQSGGLPGVNLYGTLYSPRGSWLTILGVLPGDAIAGPMQIITGALQMTLNASLDAQQLPTPPTRLAASLVQ
jgi:Putative Flp pilus-assembly TadE/G-like